MGVDSFFQRTTIMSAPAANEVSSVYFQFERFKSALGFGAQSRCPLRRHILHFFLPIQNQPQEGTKQTLDMVARHRLDNPILDILWAVVRQ